jgi:hypothetical protein
MNNNLVNNFVMEDRISNKRINIREDTNEEKDLGLEMVCNRKLQNRVNSKRLRERKKI